MFILLPQIVAYLKSSNRHMIDEDVNRYAEKRGCKMTGLWRLTWLLTEDEYYRNMFYQRIGDFPDILKFCLKESPVFFPTKNILGGALFSHPYATILNAKSIGKNFTCRQCTTIGNKKDGRNDLVPTIGDNVTVGANVVIIGDVKIGDNVIIGAGAVVVADIPDNVVIAGNPAKIIRKI